MNPRVGKRNGPAFPNLAGGHAAPRPGRWWFAGAWLALGLAAGAAPGPPAAGATNAWAFLDNGQLRLGVNRAAGACIGFFGESATGRDLLNHYDLGRYIAQSYYGELDGSFWNRQPWRWNPVQGGDWRGHATKILDWECSGSNLHARTQPKHWATGADIPELVMEQWITLTGRIAHIHFQASYTGTQSHRPHHQELPAIYIDNTLAQLVYYRGAAPWTDGPLTQRVPGPTNEYEDIPENWAAYVDTHGWGVGAYVPGTGRMTCFLVRGPGGPAGSGCAYFAPIRTLAITPGFRLDYDVYLTIGTREEIRATFRQIHDAGSSATKKEQP